MSTLTDIITECLRHGVHVTFRPRYGHNDGISLTLFGKNRKGVVLSLTRHLTDDQTGTITLANTIYDMFKELTD